MGMSPPPATEGKIGRSSAFFAGLGKRVRTVFERTGSIFWLLGRCVRGFLRLRMDQLGVIMDVLRLQLRFTALDALPICFLTALLIGAITLVQVFGQLSSLGVESYLSQLLARIVIREVGPLMVGVIVISRSGTAIATEMATMKLNREVDTLFATGINPFQFLLVPRLLGGVLSIFSLVVFFDTVALLGGFMVARLMMPMSARFFFGALGEAIGYQELAATFFKSLVFGTAIPLLCVSAGLSVERSSTEIPQAVTRAAVTSLVTILVAGAFLSVVIYA
jgi:phospholipid/cholesterol/gamma-HCH transport system permease protein